MENEKVKNGQAFPSFEQDKRWRIPAYNPVPGMSKRFYAACAAMQGLLAGTHANMSNGMVQASGTIKKAYQLADELLKQEEE